MYKKYLILKQRKWPKLVKKEEEKKMKKTKQKMDILFTFMIRKYYENVIITLMYKITKSPKHIEKINGNKIE